MQLFQIPQYSDRQDASFELLNGTTGRRALLLLCSVIPIENALWGEKLGKIGEGVISF